MIRLLVNVFWTIVAAIIILAGLIVPGMEILSIVLALLLFLWRFILYLKRRRPNINQIPQNVLDDFENAERRRINSDGQTEPHEILWEIARTRQRGLRVATKTSSGVETGELYTPYIKRPEFQSNATPRIANDKISTSRSERNNNKGLFGRKRSGR